MTELWRVITGAVVGSASAHEVTVLDAVGFALEDVTALRYLQQATAAARFLRPLDFIAELDHPTDATG